MKEITKRERLELRNAMALLGAVTGGLDVMTTGLPLVTASVPALFEAGRAYVAKKRGNEKPRIIRDHLGNLAYSSMAGAAVLLGVKYGPRIYEFANSLTQ